MITGVVIALLLLGILLLLLEILFVPGTTIVGVGGIILLAIGIYLAYDFIGPTAGHLSLASSVVVTFLALIVLLKGETWKQMALDTKIEGKSVEQLEKLLVIGERGKTISRLNPAGKALFKDKFLEVSTTGEFVDEDVNIEVVKLDQNRIKVKTV
ncbi:MAG: membrane-bound ClpP family serine protease [Bacteroidia bacterium]|jgi:membrane-bound ClpP family serine protease